MVRDDSILEEPCNESFEEQIKGFTMKSITKTHEPEEYFGMTEEKSPLIKVVHNVPVQQPGQDQLSDDDMPFQARKVKKVATA